VSLDKFDGKTWEPSTRDIDAVPDEFPTPVGLGADIRRTEITTLVAAEKGYKQDWLPMPYPPSGVKIDGDWRYEPEGMAVVGDDGQNTGGATYEVKSLVVQPTAEQLAAAPEPDAEMKDWYTKLPKSLPAVVANTARAVTKGSANHYEQAVKLQEYFSLTGGFQYDTQVDVGTGSRAIARFLENKQGFCIHFSFAMASMARSLGIPARVAVGFAPGTPQADGTVSVGLRDAHAWPELYFEGVGWTRFEPTPTRGTQPEYTQTDSPSSNLPDPGLPSRSTTTAPSASPSASESCTAEQKKLEACPSESAAVAPVTDDNGPKWYVVLAWVLGGLAALAIPLAPMLWRLRTRAVRLGAHGRSEAEAALHTLAVWQELTDTAWDFGILPDESQTPRKAAARIVRLGHLDPTAAAAVHRVADAVEQVLYAPRPRPTAGLAEDVRRAIAGLADPAPRRTELRAIFAPRSTVRVVWAASELWSGVKARAAAARPTLRKPSGQQS
jgi:transglutaminase-like putative cysteine protease